ncbi:protein of unknown function [Enterobacter cancerogenus]|nr:protein of unknown function [Enterobacter cancerogenus]
MHSDDYHNAKSQCSSRMSSVEQLINNNKLFSNYFMNFLSHLSHIEVISAGKRKDKILSA